MQLTTPSVPAMDERAEVVEHHAAACEERLHDEGVDTGEHGHGVTLGIAGGKGDVVRQVVKVIVIGLHGTRCEVLDAICAIRVLAFSNLVGNRHNSFVCLLEPLPPPSPEREGAPDIAGVGGGLVNGLG